MMSTKAINVNICELNSYLFHTWDCWLILPVKMKFIPGSYLATTTFAFVRFK